MASLRTHARSPYWYVRTKNPDTGAWEETSTGLRFDNPAETRKAQRLADRKSARERINVTAAGAAFDFWVPSFINSHFSSEASRRRYQGAWQALRLFLAREGLIYPRQVRYAHGAAYIEWRLATRVHSSKAVQHNTALLELKFLAQLLNEAKRREYLESNPLERTGITRQPQKEKPALSDDEIARAWAALENHPEWMRIAFMISLYTGCRFSECQIPLSRVNFDTWTIRMEDAKRDTEDPRKFFTVPVEQPLRPVLLAVRNRDVTCSLSQDMNGRINKVLRKAVGATFHSLRVTFVTRLHRAGLSEFEAMRLVNHSSQLVHKIYSRLNVDDVRTARSRVQLPILVLPQPNIP